MSTRIVRADSYVALALMTEASVDAIVCDPPYMLGFMGKAFDNPHDNPADDPAFWRLALRVLKPGGHLLAFGGTRTYHRMASAVEAAGFEVRDMLHWTYGSGFPKSLDVGKAIDKAAPRAGMFAQFAAHYAEQRRAAGLTHAAVCDAGGFYAEHNHGGASVNWEAGYNVPTREQWRALRGILALSGEWLPLIERVEAEREVVGQHAGDMGGLGGARLGKTGGDITAPATPEAARWDGWGTALKPSHEPVVVARKPLSGTVAANVLEWGTGAVNVNGCRVPTGAGAVGRTADPRPGGFGDVGANGRGRRSRPMDATAGRWPPNTLLSHAPGCGDDCAPGCPVAEMGRQSGVRVSGGVNLSRSGKPPQGGWGFRGLDRKNFHPNDTGTAARFFPNFDADPGFLYVAKASRAERNAGTERNAHPTVKPITVMRWLCRLVTPPGGLVLDPFAGSGSTVIAAHLEGFNAIGIEREAEYAEIARARVRWWVEDADEKARAKTVPNAGGSGTDWVAELGELGGNSSPRNIYGDAAHGWREAKARTNGHGEPPPVEQMPLL